MSERKNEQVAENPDIKAIITTDKDLVINSGVPVFLSKDQEALQELSQNLERILDASSHEINNETVIIVAR
ncbi:capping complex subunit for YIEGIA [Siminovitchia fortis]|uniref:Uncharacterized protein n=1 Tax=Siminovitchia fortis TaxID=254758 RepID=A0A443IQP4_9BACI|nr:hypothetical protein [Siminovitchia fortis]RWR08585.1 hypothetical protein D4N35_011265 [Siminovitchia fortis]WHY83176.1 hypothetical protein QNH23_07320 [Siminovitchia fortis]